MPFEFWKIFCPPIHKLLAFTIKRSCLSASTTSSWVHESEDDPHDGGGREVHEVLEDVDDDVAGVKDACLDGGVIHTGERELTLSKRVPESYTKGT